MSHSTYADLESQLSHISDDNDDDAHYQEPNSYYSEKQHQQSQPLRATTSTTAHDNSENDLIYTITTSGSRDEFIHIDNKKYLRKDLINAFGGSLIPGYQERPQYKFANPAPLGLCAFGVTTLVLSLINVQARGVQQPNIVVGLAIFYGGFIQLLAGMWEMALNNAFGATALSSFGGFWLSFGAIYIKWFGIIDAYEDPIELDNAVGFYLIGWTIFTFGLTLVTLKSTLAFFLLFFSLTITFLLLAIGKLAQIVNVTKAAGVLGIITAFIALYNAFAGLATPENSYITAKVIRLPENVFTKKRN
jgi:succinate-acetate transporter protein